MRDAYLQDRYDEGQKMMWHLRLPFKKIAKGKNRRFYRIKKNDQACKVKPLYWHTDHVARTPSADKETVYYDMDWLDDYEKKAAGSSKKKLQKKHKKFVPQRI